MALNRRPASVERRTATLGSIQVRIVAAFVAAVLIMGGSQAFLVLQQQRIAASLTLITEGYVPLSKVATLLERDRQRVENDLQRLLRNEPRPSTGPTSPALLYTDQLQENLSIARIHATWVRDHLAMGAEDQAVFHAVTAQLGVLEERFALYELDAEQIVAAADAGDRETVDGLAGPLVDEGSLLADEIEKLGRLLETRIDRLTQATEEAQIRTTALSVALTVFAVVLCFALVGAVLLALQPIGRLTTEVQRLAAGDYGGRVEVRGSDEVAVLASEFNAMVRALEARDRTLVERAEELNRLSRYLGSVLDGLLDALFVVENGTVTMANPAAERIWSVRPGDAPPERLRELLREPGRHEAVGQDGSLQQIRTAPFGEQGFVVITADVTEHTRDKERLARSERLALIGQMLAQITHEVRNPLNALSLNAELLADELSALDPERRTEAWDLLGVVAREIERLTNVTGHYLQLARRPAARLDPENLEALVRDVIRLQQGELARHAVHLQFRPQPLVPQLVDGNQLRQAILNVLRNAVEAGAHNLDLTLRRDGDTVRIALFDDGPGMTGEEIDRAWDPFFSTKAQGTGLGLAITKQILEDHDGTVKIESAPTKGTTVTLVLPYRPAPAAAEEAHAPDHPGGG